MEGTEQIQKKSSKDRLWDIVLGALTVLTTGLAIQFRDVVGTSGIIITFLLMALLFLGFKYYKLSQELNSYGVRKSDINKFYLDALKDPSTMSATVTVLDDDTYHPMDLVVEIKEGYDLEITAFANDKFNFAILDDKNYKKVDFEPLDKKILPLNIHTFNKWGIRSELPQESTPHFKIKYHVPKTQIYHFLYSRSEESKKKKIEITLIISGSPPYQGLLLP